MMRLFATQQIPTDTSMYIVISACIVNLTIRKTKTARSKTDQNAFVGAGKRTITAIWTTLVAIFVVHVPPFHHGV